MDATGFCWIGGSQTQPNLQSLPLYHGNPVYHMPLFAIFLDFVR